MHNHDYELVMALAEGSLEPAAAASARAEIEACPECAADLELQVEGLRALQALPAAELTELEAARLQRSLREELGLRRPEARRPAPRRRLPLAALGTAAAVLVAVLAVGPGLNLIGGSDSSDTAEFSAATTAAAATTTAAPAAALDMTDSAEIENGLAGGDPEPAEAPTAEATFPSTTAVRGETRLFAYYGEGDLDLFALRGELEANAFDGSATRSQMLRQADESLTEDDAGAAEACIALTLSSEEDFLEGFQLALGNIGGREVLVVAYLTDSPEESTVVAHAADNCEELGRAGP